VIARRGFLLLGGITLTWPLFRSVRRVAAELDTEEALADLERRTREYQDSLGRLVSLHDEALARAAADAERIRRLHAEGLVARRDLDDAGRAVVDARSRLEEAQRQLADSEGLLAEAHALRRLAALPPIAPGAEQATPDVVQYRGVAAWTLAQIESLDAFFEARFGRPLPVSAVGQTAVHDRLGFDHRNAVDVAVHPDSVEGRALLDYLRVRRIPFLAFRGPVAGASTGAHVHVGAPSPRMG
jgi:hypothetical protein